MDSSTVGKCRIAYCSCLSRGKKAKRNTNKLQFPPFQKKHRAPALDRNVVFSSVFLCVVVFFRDRLSRQTRFVCFEKLSGGGPICSPLVLFYGSTNSSVQASAVLSRGKENETRVEFRAGGTFLMGHAVSIWQSSPTVFNKVPILCAPIYPGPTPKC